MSKILIIDDDPTLCRNLTLALTASGYEASAAQTAAAGRAAAADADLILLDVMLPDSDGFSCCTALRNITAAPILFLTSCSDEAEIIRGLDCGADDFISKPFRLAELLSRIRANLRRTKSQQTLPQMNLTAAEETLLRYLKDNAGHYVTREQILAACWDAKGNFVNDNTLSVHISRLREKLAAARAGRIVTKRGLGYCWQQEDAP